jgi:hypothetical protein
MLDGGAFKAENKKRLISLKKSALCSYGSPSWTIMGTGRRSLKSEVIR